MYLLTSALLVFVLRWTWVNGASSTREIGNGHNPGPCNSKTEGKFAMVKNKLSVCVQEGKFRWKTGKALNRTEEHRVEQLEDFESEQHTLEGKRKRNQLTRESDEYLHKRDVTIRKRAECPCGWIPLRSSCYYFSKKTDTWPNARSYCLNRGGDLAVPTNSIESKTIWKASKLFGHFDPWIGLERHCNDKQFFTVYGLKPTYTNWYPGEPNNVHNNENCVQLFRGRDVWNDRNCDVKVHYICEKKQI